MSTGVLHLPNFTTAPPGQWRYTVPETGQTFGPEPSIDSLIYNVRQHYRANGYTVPDNETLTDNIEQETCKRQPAYCGDYAAIAEQEAKSYSPGLSHTFHNILSGTKVIGSWLLKGKQFVSQEKADQRAAVCVTCTENVDPIGCTSCNLGVIRNLIESLVGKRTTKAGDSIKACKACGCGLKAKVWVPHKILWDNAIPTQLAKLPAHCWMNTEKAQEQSTPA